MSATFLVMYSNYSRMFKSLSFFIAHEEKKEVPRSMAKFFSRYTVDIIVMQQRYVCTYRNINHDMYTVTIMVCSVLWSL